MSLSVIQMNTQADVAANLRQARRLLEQAAAGGARLAVLPENFAAMGRADLAALGRAELRGEGPVLPWLARTARELELWIVAGTLPLPADDEPEGKPRACSLVYDAHGERVARYDKLHLFDVEVADSRGRYRESDDYARGHSLVVVDTPVGRLGLSVCYDLRFAELYVALAAAGAELISAPSAFTTVTGAAHWEALLRARAIETQCYLLAAAQSGEHPGGRRTYGHSAIVDPWGRLVAAQPEGEGALVAARDAAEQASIRQRMPVARHRRFSVPHLAGTSE
ncbi:carbon-nitrogen hydrolase family protein [Stutzerimonas azotifigens]|uniref:carbon-nitrogen hydrolase family protein n=1 Tax=Stutzerimonas azotifigens TaxID=291995 RepID=UPI0003F4E27D|nr:carbon-nitrogen hydrolase family protein [Stutzerimonas azotifigens]